MYSQGCDDVNEGTDYRLRTSLVLNAIQLQKIVKVYSGDSDENCGGQRPEIRVLCEIAVGTLLHGVGFGSIECSSLRLLGPSS